MKVAICDATDGGRELWVNQLYNIEEIYDIPMEISQYTTTDQLLFHVEDRHLHPELLLLDVSLPGLDGIQAAQKIREMQLQMEIIFLTSNHCRWPEAFDVEALNYLIKGETTADRMEQVIMKAVQRINKSQERYFSFSCAGEDRAIPIRNIRYFVADRRLVIVHYGLEDSTFEFYTSFGKLEERIYNRGFVRIHKSYIVAMRYVRSMSLRNGVVLDTGEVLPLGRVYYDSAKNIYDKYTHQAQLA